MGKTKYIHYGNDQFYPELVMPISNEPMSVKPRGGLWASPEDSPRSWYDWCEIEHFKDCDLSKSFSFVLKDNANILHLHSVKQLKDLPRAKAPRPEMQFIIDRELMVYLDFEAIEKEYDGIELHLSEERWDDIEDFCSGLYYKLYSWDCDSILIFHADIVDVL